MRDIPQFTKKSKLIPIPRQSLNDLGIDTDSVEGILEHIDKLNNVRYYASKQIEKKNKLIILLSICLISSLIANLIIYIT